jgi:hypothetical protein
MVQETKSPIINLARQRCAEGFNSGVKGLKTQSCAVRIQYIQVTRFGFVNMPLSDHFLNEKLFTLIFTARRLYKSFGVKGLI